MLTNSVTLIVGPSGCGKTSLIMTAAERCWKKYKKVTRFCAYDLGGFGDKAESLIRKGIVEVWRPFTRDPSGALGLPLETIELACAGWWPAVVDPETGDCDPGTVLVPPRTISYKIFCGKCKNAVAEKPQKVSFSNENFTCPECKEVVNLQTCDKIEQFSSFNHGFDHVGFWASDGLTSMAQWAGRDMAARASRNELGGEKAAINTVTSGNIKFGGLSRASFGFVQNRVNGWIQNSLTIQGLVQPPVMTALEMQITDDNAVTIYGPKVFGKAITEDIPGMVGNCLGAVVMDTERGKKHRLYLSQYTLPGDNTPHLCKNRATPGTMPEYMEDDEKPFDGFNLGKFFDLIDEALEKEEVRQKEEVGEGPGKPNGRLEVGSRVGVIAPAGGVKAVAASGRAVPAALPKALPKAK